MGNESELIIIMIFGAYQGLFVVQVAGWIIGKNSPRALTTGFIDVLICGYSCQMGMWNGEDAVQLGAFFLHCLSLSSSLDVIGLALATTSIRFDSLSVANGVLSSSGINFEVVFDSFLHRFAM